MSDQHDNSKILKGDKVLWEGLKYNIEAIEENYKDGQNLYTICRMDSEDGVKLKVKCLKILADERELQKIGE